MKKICFISGYYYPDVTADSHLNLTLCEGLRSLGYEIHVITPFPSRGLTRELKEKYKNIRDEITPSGVMIHRVGYQSCPRNMMMKAFDWLAKIIFIYVKSKKIDADIFIIMSTPPMLGLLGRYINKNAKVIYRLQDIFPDNLILTGKFNTDSFSFRQLKKLERYMYQKNDAIVTISNDMKKYIIENNNIANKVEVVYNWIDINKCIPIEREKNVLIKEWNIKSDDFCVVYAGNLGIAQNIETILKASELLQGYDNIKFIIVGDGSKKKFVVDFLENSNCKNVKLYNMQPMKLVSHVYSLGDVDIVSLKKGVSRLAMPSKTWSIMSAGRAVICEIDSYSELNEIIKKNKCGYTCEPNDYSAMAAKILELYNDREKCKAMGLNARRFVEKNLTVEQGIEKFNAVIKRIR